MVVVFAARIAACFATANAWHWLGVIATGLELACSALALGCAQVWGKAWLFGAEPIARPVVTVLDATVLAREEQPAEHRVRLLLATREPGGERVIKVQVNLDPDADNPAIDEGARVRLRARLVPPLRAADAAGRV